MTVYNKAFRDEAAESQYPLDPLATEDIFPTQLLLDAALYVPSTFRAPFYISGVQPAQGTIVRFLISDARGTLVATALCDYQESSGTAVLYTDYGRSAGVLVFDPEYMERLRGELHDGPRSYSSNETRLASEIVRYFNPKGVLNISANDVSFQGGLNIVFGGGLRYNDGGGLDLYGEEDSQDYALLSINGRGGEHVLLMAHVFKDYENESALRLETFGSYLVVGKSRDF